MGLVEKVDAEIRYDLPMKKYMQGGFKREKPVDNVTVKQMEDFCFGLRTRGAGDDTKIKAKTGKFWDGYSHTYHLTGFSVEASATMDGFPALNPEPQQKDSITIGRVPFLIILAVILNILLILTLNTIF